MMSCIETPRRFAGSWSFGACVLASLICLGGCGRTAARAQFHGAMTIPVTMTPVAARIYPDESEFMAEVDSKHSVEIHPQVSSRVTAVLVADGQEVRAGQALYQLDTSQQAALVRSSEASRRAALEQPQQLQEEIDAQKADLVAAREDLAFDKKQLQRYEELVKDHTVSEKDTEQYQTLVLSQEQKLKSLADNIASEEIHKQEAMASIEMSTGTYQSARAHLNYYTVRAPFQGIVGTLIAKLGDVVDTGTVLTTLTDNRNLEIDVSIPVDYRGRVRLGTRVTLLSIDDHPLAESEISYISPDVDPATQTLLVKAKVLNASKDLSVDEHLKARLIWGHKRAILVPMPAVFRMDGQPFVYRAVLNNKGEGKTAHLQAVLLGPIVDQDVVIESGLKPGQILITGGIQKLQDGVPVMASSK